MQLWCSFKVFALKVCDNKLTSISTSRTNSSEFTFTQVDIATEKIILEVHIIFVNMVIT